MLQLDHLRCEFGDGFSVTANLVIQQGSWTSIVGPSGSGKTTLVQAIAGFVQPSSGDILIDGSSLLNLTPSQRPFAVVFQKDTLFEHLCIKDNLLLAMHDSDLSKSAKQEFACQLIQNVQLDKGFLQRFPATLSGGQRARVSVARALARGAKWLILDESFSSLDEKLRIELHFWLEQLRLMHGLTILSVTHQQIEARIFSDLLIAMNMGKVVFCGAPNQLEQDAVSNPTSYELYEPFFLERSQIEENGEIIYLEKSGTHDVVKFIFDQAEFEKRETNVRRHQLQDPLIVALGKRFALRERGKRTLIYFSAPLAKTPIGLEF